MTGNKGRGLVTAPAEGGGGPFAALAGDCTYSMIVSHDCLTFGTTCAPKSISDNSWSRLCRHKADVGFYAHAFIGIFQFIDSKT